MTRQIALPDFPRTLDQRVYHLGIRAGEVANRIVSIVCCRRVRLEWTHVPSQVTVGSPSRAAGIARHLDASPAPFTLSSERGFTTITGRCKGVPVSIVSIGMGSANADFFVREVRECLSGDMLVVRSMARAAPPSHADARAPQAPLVRRARGRPRRHRRRAPREHRRHAELRF